MDSVRNQDRLPGEETQRGRICGGHVGTNIATVLMILAREKSLCGPNDPFRVEHSWCLPAGSHHPSDDSTRVGYSNIQP